MIELLMVIVFFFFLTYTVTVTVRSAVVTKEKVDRQLESLQVKRALQAIFENDLRASFYNIADDQIWRPDYTDVPEQELSAPNHQKPTPITVFKGERRELLFSSQSHQRLSRNSPENEQHFVFFNIKSGQLIRSESPRAVSEEDREDEKNLRSFVLIDGVKQFQFSYWDKKTGKWENKWDSENRNTLNLIPAAVKVAIEYEIEDAQKKKQNYQIEMMVRLTEDEFRNYTEEEIAKRNNSLNKDEEDQYGDKVLGGGWIT